MGVRERREKEREQRRLTILAAARTVFDQHGLEGVSMDRIAQVAELAKGTVYLYFKSREELMMALIAQEMDDLIVLMQQVAESPTTPQAQLLEMVHVFYRFSQENRFFYRMITQVNLQHVCAGGETPSHVAELFTEQNQRMFAIILGILERGVELGVFHLQHPAPYIVAQMMLSTKGAMVMLQNGMMPPVYAIPPTEDVLDAIASLMIRGLMCDMPSDAVPTTNN
jgi:AcrR family transcriptional regulator